tara:strand:+ start:246 stop:371 length:126 start_codon:yes stop_codon:yes gene_type:complete
MVNTTEKCKTLLLLEKLIDDDILLEAVRDFEQHHYNYDNIN